MDDQKVVYETALAIAREAAATGKKQVVIVDGGPGTGKSVVAINLLVALTAGRLRRQVRDQECRAARRVQDGAHGVDATHANLDNLFVGSGAFTETQANVFDALVVDEAHRLNEKSGLYGNQGTHQVEEIIGSAKCAIFFIDEDQRVTWKDIGEKKDIERRAKRAGAKVTHLQLASQFRCSGSDGYLAWLDDTLGIRETANPELDVAEFDFRVFDSPEELRKVIVEKNTARNKARMVAGYCWDWKSKKDAQGRGRRDPGARVRDAVEPDAGRRAVDHGAGVGGADRLHPHLPGARGGLHRRGRRAGPHRAGWQGRRRSRRSGRGRTSRSRGTRRCSRRIRRGRRRRRI